MGFWDGLMQVAGPLLGFAGSAGGTYMNAKMQRRGQEFEHNEAILNRDFQQRNFDRGMEFNSAQAAKAMDFERRQSAIGRDFNHDEAGLARSFNQREAERQRRYEAGMANSQYQRAVGDLKKAGLNPIMAAFHGGNAVPGGAAASGPAASSGGNARGIAASSPGAPGGSKASWSGNVDYSRMGEAVNTAFAVRERSETIKNLQANNELLKAQTAATRTQANLNTASASEHVQRVENLKTQIQEMQEHIRTMITQQGEHQAGAGEKVSRSELNRMQTDLAKAEIGLTTRHSDLYQAQTEVERVMVRLRGYELPAAENRAHASGTWWGKNVSPYLPDAAMFGGSAAAIRSVFGR